jgi:hypothetical protein
MQNANTNIDPQLTEGCEVLRTDMTVTKPAISIQHKDWASVAH